MKLIGVIILLFCLLAATFSQWVVIACFDLNENFIVKELCVNKNNPASHCNGHCYLSKELNKDEKSSNPLSTASKAKFEIQLFCIDLHNNINIVSSLLSFSHFGLQKFTEQEFLDALFHPPSVA